MYFFCHLGICNGSFKAVPPIFAASRHFHPPAQAIPLPADNIRATDLCDISSPIRRCAANWLCKNECKN